MKKIIILSVLLALSLFLFNCGGGAGSSDSPKGENPGVPSVVQLLPSHYIAQTNSSITLHAQVLDGNGAPVRGVNVRFTNLSPIGVLSTTSIQTADEGSMRIASDQKTDSTGIATVTLKSTSDGFSTIQAEVNSGVSQVRDRKTVFFSAHNVSDIMPFLDLDVSGNGDPYTLFENQNDNFVTVTATVYFTSLPITGSQVTFGTDRPYKVGSGSDVKCSDGSDVCDVTFPAGNTAITNTAGKASVPVMVVPSILIPIQTTMNVYAVADNGAFNIVTLFLQPVSINTISVAANPTVVDSGGTSAITAYVTTTAGTPVPDGTSVNFVASVGGIDTFSQTTNGLAKASFKAPTLEAGGSDQLVSIIARVGAKQSSPISVRVKAPPAPEPEPAP